MTGPATTGRSSTSVTTAPRRIRPSPRARRATGCATEPHLLVSKQVNSAFHGSPDLHAWLLGHQTAGIVVCGITTNHCCETTVRVGANLGHDVLFPIDATFCHDRRHPDGITLSADELTRATAPSLHGEFANVTTTEEILAGRARPID